MLYLEQPANTFSRWSGDAIRSVRYPLNIEELWSGQQLAAIGLYVPVDPGVPDEKVTMGSHVARVDGVVTFVYNLEDAPAQLSTRSMPSAIAALVCPQPVSPSGGRSFSINTDDICATSTGSRQAVLAKITSSTTPTPFIAADNSIVSLSPDDLISVGCRFKRRSAS